MKYYSDSYLLDTGLRIFKELGSAKTEAEVVSRHLVEASLMGVDSHGVIRFGKYIDEALGGVVKPGVPISTVSETPISALLDGHFNFGIVTANAAAELAASKAKDKGISCVVTQRTHHVGRLGAHAQRLAERGLIGLAFAAANTRYNDRQRVAPWGGREGRIGTNPLAYAVPGKDGHILFDMSTAAIAMGKIHNLRRAGKEIPENLVLDETGHPTTDPEALFGSGRSAILPFGYSQGHKGFGLGLVCEILTGLLHGAGPDADEPRGRYANDLSVIAIDPGLFGSFEDFEKRIDAYGNYITSCPAAPGFNEVLMPGTLERRVFARRSVSGIPLEEKDVETIQKACRKIGVEFS